jgi:hypothetical protein
MTYGNSEGKFGDLRTGRSDSFLHSLIQNSFGLKTAPHPTEKGDISPWINSTEE